MGIGNESKESYLSGFSCGEAVIKTIKDHKLTDMPSEVIKVCSTFKTGIGGAKGDLCGSFLGGLIAIGVKYGRDNNKDDISDVNQKSCLLYTSPSPTRPY